MYCAAMWGRYTGEGGDGWATVQDLSIHFSSSIQSSKPYTIFGGLVPVDDKISPWADRESKAFFPKGGVGG